MQLESGSATADAKEKSMTIPYLKLTGTPQEIGASYGDQARDLIAHNLTLYFRRFENEAGLPRSEVLKRADRYLDVIETHAPDYNLMMKAMAEASGFPLIDVAALNVRYEILYSAYSMIGMEEGEHCGPGLDCTAFAICSESSADGHLRIGQNWDWIPDVKCVLTEVELPSGMSVLCLNEAGIAGGKIGFNSKGLGLLVNGLMSNLDDWSRVGEPFHVKTWKVLCSENVDEALDVLRTKPHPCSANFLFAQHTDGGSAQHTDGDLDQHTDGGSARPADSGKERPEIYDVEIYPGGEVIRETESEFFVHANHFLDPDAVGIWQPFRKDCLTTFDRHARMQALLEAESSKEDQISEQFLESALRDHDKKPDSICRHRNPNLPESDQIRTVLSVIIDLTSRAMKVAPGPPCEESYIAYGLKV